VGGGGGGDAATEDVAVCRSLDCLYVHKQLNIYITNYATRRTLSNVNYCGSRGMSVFTNTNILKLTGYFMHQQFNIQQLYALPTLY
jgi:hypothetical protein